MNIPAFLKSKSRRRIERKIAEITALLTEVAEEKNKYKYNDPAKYAKYWAIEADYKRNIELLKEMI